MREKIVTRNSAFVQIRNFIYIVLLIRLFSLLSKIFPTYTIYPIAAVNEIFIKYTSIFVIYSLL